MINFLINIKLSEADKRLIIAVFLLVLIVFLIFGLIYDSIKLIMVKQGKRIDALMNLPVSAGLIMSRKQFRKIAHYKNDVYFYKGSRRYVLILTIAAILHVAYFLLMTYVAQTPLNIWDTQTGFATILPTFDWANMETSVFFGITLPSNWPPIINRPHFEVLAIGSYVIVPLYITCMIGGFLTILGYLSRTIRIYTLSNMLFSADLSETRIHDLGDLTTNEKTGVGINTPEKVTTKPEK